MDYFGFESADWHEFEDAYTLFIGGATTLICDGYGSLRGAAETVDDIAVTFDFRAYMPERPFRAGTDDVFDVYFAPGTFPLPNGYTKADAEEMIVEHFSISAEPPILGTRVLA